MSIFSKMTAVLLLCLPLSIFAQSLPVSGMVTDLSDGKPIEGVTIQVKDSDNKVTTDNEGNYDIFVKRNFFTPSPPPILVFSHKDYEPTEIEVVDDQLLNVSLRSLSAISDEKIFCTGTAQDINCASLPFSGQLLDDPLLINQVEINLHNIDALENGVLDQCQRQKVTPQAWCPLAVVAYALPVED